MSDVTNTMFDTPTRIAMKGRITMEETQRRRKKNPDLFRC